MRDCEAAPVKLKSFSELDEVRVVADLCDSCSRGEGSGPRMKCHVIGQFTEVAQLNII